MVHHFVRCKPQHTELAEFVMQQWAPCNVCIPNPDLGLAQLQMFSDDTGNREARTGKRERERENRKDKEGQWLPA